MNSNIPDEAVEVAARELFFQHSNTNGPSLSLIWDEALNEDLKSPFMRDARAALEAALPYLLPLGPHVTWGSEVTPANTAHIAHCPQCRAAFSR